MSSSSSPLSTPPSSSPAATLKPIPPATLLVSLPGLVIHPPYHRYHAQSLWISLLALRRCLRLPNLSPDIECRAWTALAEIGMIVIQGDHDWAPGIEAEVEEATTQGLLIAQRHPTLRSYRPQLTFLAAQLASWQRNTKFARNLLRRLLPTFLPTDSPHIVYTAHLKYIEHLLTSTSSSSSSKSGLSTPSKSSPQDIRAALAAIQNMQNLALKNNHTQVVLLTRVIRLRLLVSTGMWEDVKGALDEVEKMLGLVWASEKKSDGDETPKPKKKVKADTDALVFPSSNATKQAYAHPTPTPNLTLPGTNSKIPDRFQTSIFLHALVIGVVFYTYVGKMVESHHRLAILHDLLDGGVLRFSKSKSKPKASQSNNTSSPEQQQQYEDEEEDPAVRERAACGIVEIRFSGSSSSSFPSSSSSSSQSSYNQSPPLYIQTTHPRILFVLVYLVTCIAKLDPVGRNPKRKVFAKEGLGVWEREVGAYLRLGAGSGAHTGTNPDSDVKINDTNPNTVDVASTSPPTSSIPLPVPWSSWSLPPYTPPTSLSSLSLRLIKIKADLMCELIGVEIMRCEFGKAEEGLEELIEFLRVYDREVNYEDGYEGLWDSFSARVTLYYAYLAHAKGDGDHDYDGYGYGIGKDNVKVKVKVNEEPESESNLSRALRCYRVAEMIAMERGDEYVATAARAGSVGVRIGMMRTRGRMCAAQSPMTKMKTKTETKGKGKEKANGNVDKMDMDVDDDDEEEEDELSSFSDESWNRKRDQRVDMDVDMDMNELEDENNDAQEKEDSKEWDQIVRDGYEVAERCRGLGGTMWSVGRVIEACLSEEIITAKQHLRAAVERLSASGDNHLRTLVLALIASHYFHTSMDTALDLLASAENLGAGMGAGVKKSKRKDKESLSQSQTPTQAQNGEGDAVGSALLRRWVGQRLLEIYKRTGDEGMVKNQEKANDILEEAVRRSREWGGRGLV